MKPCLTCKQLQDFLADYADDSLPAEQRDEFHRHLAICPSCVYYVEQYKTTIALGKAAFDCPDDAPPADVPEELIQAILAARKKRK